MSSCWSAAPARSRTASSSWTATRFWPASRSAASRAAWDSSTTLTSVMRARSVMLTSVTKVPRWGIDLTRFSSARRWSASRIGVRPISSSSRSRDSCTTDPGAISRLTIRSLIRMYAASLCERATSGESTTARLGTASSTCGVVTRLSSLTCEAKPLNSSPSRRPDRYAADIRRVTVAPRGGAVNLKIRAGQAWAWAIQRGSRSESRTSIARSQRML
jgi:hypothetical protein